MAIVAITGGTGFLGRAVVSRLDGDGDLHIRLLSRSREAWPDRDDVVFGDLDDDAACSRLVAGADVVVHAAGLVRSRDVAALQRVNVDGTRRLLVAAQRAGVRRFIHISSTGVYGLPGRRVDETSGRHPTNPYERSKAIAEASVLGERDAGEIAVVQPSNLIGVGSPLRPLRRLLRRLRAGRPIVHAGAWTNYVGVVDVARVIHAAATVKLVPKVLIVNDPMPLDAFLALAGSVVGRPGRTVRVPAVVGRGLAPVVGAAAAHASTLERVRALVDQTRFVTAEQEWFDRNALALDIRGVLTEMAVDYGLSADR